MRSPACLPKLPPPRNHGGISVRLASGLLCILLAISSTCRAPADEPEWVYLDNGKLRAGVRKDAGACLGFLAGPDGKNVFNSFDHGRFVQQSYYGAKDGSDWNGKPWTYNPVQGGDWKGHPATLLEFKPEKTSLYAKTKPRHWASGADVPEMVMEEWISLEGDWLHARFKMTYHGTVEHPAHDQEIPAVFVEPRYATLVVKEGAGLRKWKPGWPNESVKLPEHWAMWLDDEGRGVGLYVPVAEKATCYRFGDGKHPSSCSYIAPLATFALTPGKTFAYEAWFTVGTEEELLERIKSIQH